LMIQKVKVTAATLLKPVAALVLVVPTDSSSAYTLMLR
jgi:hypothetical protein